MRMLTFAGRNTKEILRDPLNLGFMFGFPLVLLFLMSAIQANIPVPLFEIEHLAPGVAIFGLAFMSLFSATIIAKDRSSSLLQRLYTTPLTAADFILGYTLPIIPIAMIQSVVCYVAAVILGLDITVNIFLAILLIIPISLLYIGIGLLCGSVLNDKQVGGICGGLLTNVSAWLSGIWFDLDLVGGVFRKIADLLPFAHGVELEQAVAAGDMAAALPHLPWILGYGLAAIALAVFVFFKKMRI
jgi:ABC-2 type transport system permease protein